MTSRPRRSRKYPTRMDCIWPCRLPPYVHSKSQDKFLRRTYCIDKQWLLRWKPSRYWVHSWWTRNWNQQLIWSWLLRSGLLSRQGCFVALGSSSLGTPSLSSWTTPRLYRPNWYWRVTRHPWSLFQPIVLPRPHHCAFLCYFNRCWRK